MTPHHAPIWSWNHTPNTWLLIAEFIDKDDDTHHHIFFRLHQKDWTPLY